MKNVFLFIVLGLFFVGCDDFVLGPGFACYAPDPGIWYCEEDWDGDDTDMGSLCDNGIGTGQFETEYDCENWHIDSYSGACDCVQYLP